MIHLFVRYAASLPPFHALSIYITQLLYPTAALKNACVYTPTSYHDPTTAPVFPNTQNVIEAVLQTKSTALLVVPSFLEEWVNSPHVVQVLAGLEYVVRLYLLFHFICVFFPCRLNEHVPSKVFCGGPLHKNGGRAGGCRHQALAKSGLGHCLACQRYTCQR